MMMSPAKAHRVRIPRDPKEGMASRAVHKLILACWLALSPTQGFENPSSGTRHRSRQPSSTASAPHPCPSSALLVRRSPLSRGLGSSTTVLRGVSEWRDLMFNFPGSGDDRRLGREQGAPPREVCILPFPYTDVLLQGETKQLRLYEERFIQLFDTCMNQHEGVVAMGLLTDSGIIQTVPLCEIEAYNRLDGFGIFVTIRAVSRAQLLQVTQQEPYLKGVCVEIADKLPPNLELPNLVAHNIENLMLHLSSMEHRLAQAAREGDDEGEGGSAGMVMDDEDREMQRRIALAKLEDRFYDEDDDDDDDDDDDEDESNPEPKSFDRRARFRKAYQIALSTDTQGYAVKSGGDSTIDRTPQELTAVSWAAFCTEILPDADAAYRIQALDYENLFDRLKLALSVLRQKKEQLKAKMDKAGIKFRSDDLLGGDDDDEPTNSTSK